MNYSRIALAGLGALVVYFALGFLLLAVLPVADELRQYAAVYRAPESMNRVAPVGMVALLVAMMALAALYSLAYRDGPAFAQRVALSLRWHRTRSHSVASNGAMSLGSLHEPRA